MSSLLVSPSLFIYFICRHQKNYTMKEDFLFEKYYEALERDRAINQEIVRVAFELRDLTLKLIHTGRIRKRDAAATLGITTKALRTKVKSNKLNFEECKDLIDAYIKSKEGNHGKVGNKNATHKSNN
jgi:hypothetical protein